MSIYVKQNETIEQLSGIVAGGYQFRFKIGGDIYGNSITTIS